MVNAARARKPPVISPAWVQDSDGTGSSGIPDGRERMSYWEKKAASTKPHSVGFLIQEPWQPAELSSKTPWYLLKS